MERRIATREETFRPRIGEHPALSASLRATVAPFFLDGDIEDHFAAARRAWPRHPGFDEVKRAVAGWARGMELLVPPGLDVREAEAFLGRAVHDIVLFPAYALGGLTSEDLGLFGRLWTVVFHVDDEFDEGSTAAIARAVREADDPCPSSRATKLEAVCRRFERVSRAQAAELVAIFEGEDTAESAAARALLDIRRDLVRALRAKHGVSTAVAFARIGHVRDALYRMLDVRTSEIRHRVDARVDITEEEYHALRLYTIAMEPLVELGLLLASDEASWAGLERLRKTAAFEQLYDAVKLQISYVNDLVSFAKELREPNLQNVVIQRIGRAVGEARLADLFAEHARNPRGEARGALEAAVNEHLLPAIMDTMHRCNRLLQHVVTQAGLLDEQNPASELLAHAMVSWIAAHYLYGFEIERYAESIPFLFAAAAGKPLPAWSTEQPRRGHPIRA